MKRYLANLALSAVLLTLLLGITYGARAAWSGAATYQQPSADRMAPAAPTRQVVGSAGEVHVTFAAGSCIQIDCGDSDCRYLTSVSTSATTCGSTTCFPLRLKTTKSMCLPSAQDYLSIYMMGAGESNVSVLKDPG